jgi:hypothetical protein
MTDGAMFGKIIVAFDGSSNTARATETVVLVGR